MLLLTSRVFSHAVWRVFGFVCKILVIVLFLCRLVSVVNDIFYGSVLLTYNLNRSRAHFI